MDRLTARGNLDTSFRDGGRRASIAGGVKAAGLVIEAN